MKLQKNDIFVNAVIILVMRVNNSRFDALFCQVGKVVRMIGQMQKRGLIDDPGVFPGKTYRNPSIPRSVFRRSF
jgi:hypothetical protein